MIPGAYVFKDLHELKAILKTDPAFPRRSDPKTKKRIRSLARESVAKKRHDVLKHLRKITPAGSTGESFICFHAVISLLQVFFVRLTQENDSKNFKEQMYPCQDNKFLNLSQGNNPNEGLHRHNRFNLIRLTLFN